MATQKSKMAAQIINFNQKVYVADTIVGFYIGFKMISYVLRGAAYMC